MSQISRSCVILHPYVFEDPAQCIHTLVKLKIPNFSLYLFVYLQRRAQVSPCTYTVVCQKAPVGLKQRQTVKKIKTVAVAIIKLCLSEGISQSAEIFF